MFGLKGLGLKRLTTAKLSLLLAVAPVVCVGQMRPIDSDNYAAKVMTLTGQVSVLKDSTQWALEVGSSVNVKELIITGPDGHAQFQVSDGSTFEVYPNSRVVFRKNAPNWRDLLDVLVGRVKVHIERLGGQPNPNRVLTPTAVISVRGTTFNISVEDEDETTLVEVEEGLVEVQHALLPRGNAKMLSAGESIRVFKNEPLASSLIDKGDLFRRVFRAALDAATTIATRTPKIGSIGGGSGGSGDVKKPPPPPPPPALGPPPPPPPLGPGHLVSSGSDAGVPVQPAHQESRFHKVAHVLWRVVSTMFLEPAPHIDIR
jgi:hypothetical protein